MKRFSILIPLLMITLIISACGARGAEATPTINAVELAVELQGTIIAAGFTNVAQTQTALPTSTPVPPTVTPVATSTFPPLPTLDPGFTPIPTATSGVVDPCINTVLPASLLGKPIKIRIDNPTKAALMVSVNLHQAGPQAQCGYRGYSLSAGQSLVISDLVEGCYSIWAWNPDPKGYFMVTNGTSCLNSSATWVFDISTSTIKLRE